MVLLRAAALVVDVPALSAPFVLAGVLIGNASGTNTGNGFDLSSSDALAATGIGGLVGLLYFLIGEGVFGATLGKLALGLRVTTVDGRTPGIVAALVRTLLRLVDGLFAGIVGAVAILASKRHQRIGDMAAGTLVVRRAQSGGLYALGIVGALLLAGGGIGAAVALHEPGDPDRGRLTATLARDTDGDGGAIDPGTTFPATVEQVVATFRVSGAAPDATVRAVWRVVDVGAAAEPNQELDASEVTLTQGDARGSFSLRRSTPRWVPGQYEVELFINDRSVLTLPFTIEADPTAPPNASPRPLASAAPSAAPGRSPSPATTPQRSASSRPALPSPGPRTGGPITATLARDVSPTYTPIDPTNVYSPDAESFQLAFKAANAPANAKLRSVWRVVNVGTAPAPGTVIDQAEVTLTRGDEPGAFRLRRGPTPWPEGEYQVELFVNDRSVLTIPFQVAR